MKRVLFSLTALLFLSSASLPASGQAISVDEPSVCYACHDDIQEMESKRNVHGAFAIGECSSCHNPHASKHAALMNSSIDATCFECHDEIKDELSQGQVHQPAAIGDCLACHDPHASDYAGVLKQSAGALCLSCHENANEWLSRGRVHAPVAARRCSTCHASHGSQHDGLLTESMPAVCFDCHDNDAAFKQTHQGYELATADCGACHDPHSSTGSNLLMTYQHAPFEAGDCGSCHSRDATSGGSFAIGGGVDKVCYTCHDDIKDSKRMKFAGHLDAEGSCSNCHNPHASNASTLLSSGQDNLCMKCHFAEVPSKDKPKYITHEGQDCTICHVPHGSSNAKYLANDDPVALCNTCHADAHRNSHPMGEDAIDPRNDKPIDCLSCHKMHGSDQDFYLAFDADMDLCIQCHKR